MRILVIHDGSNRIDMQLEAMLASGISFSSFYSLSQLNATGVKHGIEICTIDGIGLENFDRLLYFSSPLPSPSWMLSTKDSEFSTMEYNAVLSDILAVNKARVFNYQISNPLVNINDDLITKKTLGYRLGLNPKYILDLSFRCKYKKSVSIIITRSQFYLSSPFFTFRRNSNIHDFIVKAQQYLDSHSCYWLCVDLIEQESELHCLDVGTTPSLDFWRPQNRAWKIIRRVIGV